MYFCTSSSLTKRYLTTFVSKLGFSLLNTSLVFTLVGGYDLLISSNANTNQDSYTELGNTYHPPRGYEPGTPQAKALLAGSYQFVPTENGIFC